MTDTDTGGWINHLAKIRRTRTSAAHVSKIMGIPDGSRWSTITVTFSNHGLPTATVDFIVTPDQMRDLVMLAVEPPTNPPAGSVDEVVRELQSALMRHTPVFSAPRIVVGRDDDPDGWVELHPGYGKNAGVFIIPPELAPSFEPVVYDCEACGGTGERGRRVGSRVVREPCDHGEIVRHDDAGDPL